MSFLNPLLLFGMIGLSLPILAHLLNRFEVKHTDWAAMRFLNRSVRIRSRQLRLRDLLLLLLRCLALVLLLLALTRPFVSEEYVLAQLGAPRTGVVIAIDGSCSMQHRDGTATRFDRALKKAAVVAQSIRAGDPVSLVVLGSEHRVVTRNMSFDADAFSELLGAQEAGFESLDLDSVPRALDGLAGELRAPQREIYLITDMLAHQWKPRSAWLKAALDDLADVASVFVIPIDGATENLAITGLELVSGVLRKDTTARYRATVRNYGDEAVENVQVSGLVNTISVDRKVIPALAPGASESVSLVMPFRDPGAVRITASLADDALSADNARRAVAVIRDQVSVLCVDGNASNGESALIAAALQARGIPESEADLVVQSVSWIDLPAQDLKRFDLVILANVPDITDAQAQAFEHYVREGHGLIWFAGDLVKADAWNQRSMRAHASLLPAVIEGAVATCDAMGLGRSLDPAVMQHPVCRTLGSLPEDLLSEARFHRMLQVKPAATSVTVLSLAGSDEPVLLEHALGRGHVFMFTTSAGSSWNNIAVTPVYPLLMQQIVTYLTARKFETSRTVGDSLTLSYAEQPDTTEAVFDTPSGELITVPVREHHNRYVALLDNAREAGFYMARVDLQAAGVPIAVNVDTRESAVKGVSPEMLAELLAGTRVRTIRSDGELRGAAEEVRTVRSLWRVLMMAGILLVLIEGLLAWYLAGRRGGPGI